MTRDILDSVAVDGSVEAIEFIGSGAKLTDIPQSATLDGFNAGSGGVVLETDTILTAIEKLEYKINNSFVTEHSFAFTYDIITPVIIYTIPANTRIWSVLLSIDVAFDGIGATLKIGDAVVSDHLMAISQNDLTDVAVYSTTPAYEYTGITEIVLTIVPGTSASQGSGCIKLIF